MKAILDGIWTRLSAATIYTTLGGRIYLNQGPADALLPLMVYQAAEATSERLMGGVVKYTLEVEFTIFYDNAGSTAIHTIADQLRTALSTSASATGFDRITFVQLAGGVPSFSDDSWSMVERYRVTAFDI